MLIFNPQILAQMLYEAPERSGKTLRQVSREMGGIDERYLSRQLNPHDEGAKLGVIDFVFLASVTDLEPLDLIEKAFGRMAVPIPDQLAIQAEKPFWCQHLSTIIKETSEASGSLAEALADNAIDDDERKKCLTETIEAIQALTALKVALEK